MPVLNFRKVTALPSVLEPTTLYMVKDSGNKLQLCLTDKVGDAMWKTHSVTEISSLINLLIEAQKGQPGGLAYLDANGNIVGGSTTSLTSLDGQNGDIRSNGAYVWKTVTEQLIYRNISGGTNPTWGTLFANQQGLLFSGTGLNQTWCDIVFGNDCLFDGPFRLSIPFIPLTTAAGTVRLGVEYHVANAFGVGTFSATGINMTVDVNVAANTARKPYTAVFPEITGKSIEPGAVVKARVYRDGAADSHNANIHFNVMNLHYKMARLGTRNYLPAFSGI